MLHKKNIINGSIFASFLILLGVTFLTPSAFATDESQVQNQMPADAKPDETAVITPVVKDEDRTLEIKPICSTASANKSQWKVFNKGSETTELVWNNVENDKTGTFEAVSGTSTLITYYNPNDPNNRTEFTYLGNTVSRNAQVEECNPPLETEPTPPTEDCVDGSIQQNLIVQILSKNLATVTTANGKPLCEDITISFSSYTMPDKYNGNGHDFYTNPNATPQYIFGNKTVTLKKGTTGTKTLEIKAPSDCKNVQVDVYYGKKIKKIGKDGHGTRNILSKIYPATQKSCNPGQGGGQTPTPPSNPTPTTPMTPTPGKGSIGPVEKQNIAARSKVAPKKVSAPAPSELPETGASTNGFLYAIAIAILAYAAVYFVQPKREFDQ